MKQFIFVIVYLISFNTFANLVETKWEVKEYFGEVWYANPKKIIGKNQEFYQGYSQGIFYNCYYEGQSYTYTRYKSHKEFHNNKEFLLFERYIGKFDKTNGDIFVHRITCSGNNEFNRKVFYPFITFENIKIAYYLFEGAIYKLEYN
tara:strand:- start:632 stop:1072 length:441 start_codon:yes stop_codon:yes gene_type:complete